MRLWKCFCFNIRGLTSTATKMPPRCGYEIFFYPISVDCHPRLQECRRDAAMKCAFFYLISVDFHPRLQEYRRDAALRYPSV